MRRQPHALQRGPTARALSSRWETAVCTLTTQSVAHGMRCESSASHSAVTWLAWRMHSSMPTSFCTWIPQARQKSTGSVPLTRQRKGTGCGQMGHQSGWVHLTGPTMDVTITKCRLEEQVKIVQRLIPITTITSMTLAVMETIIRSVRTE